MTSKLLGNSGGSRIAETSCVSNINASDSDIFYIYDKFVASSSSQIASKSPTELDMHLEEIFFPRTQHFDILSWWKTNEAKYPNLQKRANDILAIPVSTVAHESAFSNSGTIVGHHRSRLNPTTLEVLMCSRRLLWDEVEDNSSSSLPTCPTILDEEEDDSEECVGNISYSLFYIDLFKFCYNLFFGMSRFFMES
ncbi:uncharacterized protein [Primulina eburnea]|uniref:uncharacterized protein n=1 Tax=Primulina eburnea TaxID=1245227 RepID=UPI003C6C1CDF